MLSIYDKDERAFQVQETYLGDTLNRSVYFSTEALAWDYVRERLLAEIRALLERDIDRGRASYGYYLEQLIHLAKGDADDAASEWAEPIHLAEQEEDDSTGLTPLPGGDYLASIWVHPIKLDGELFIPRRVKPRKLELRFVEKGS